MRRFLHTEQEDGQGPLPSMLMAMPVAGKPASERRTCKLRILIGVEDGRRAVTRRGILRGLDAEGRLDRDR